MRTVVMYLVWFGLLLPAFVLAQQIKPVCAYCNRSEAQLAASGHASSCPYYVAPKKVPSKITPSYSNSMQMMVTSTLLQGIFSGLFSTNQQQQQKEQQQKLLAEQQKLKALAEAALQKKIKDSLDQLHYLKLMSSYKLLQGGSMGLLLKKPDGDMEAFRAGAASQFDGGIQVKDTVMISAGTPFFGTKMDSVQINTLIDPDNDSVITDINNADLFIRENAKADSVRIAKLADSMAKSAVKDPLRKNPPCDKLQARLHNYLIQRDKFHQTILTTQKELMEWKQKNTDALWNAATSGFELLFSKFLANIALKGVQAENIRIRLLKNEEALRAKGVDFDKYMGVLNQRVFTANHLAKEVAEFKDAVEYDAFFRDAVQVGASRIAETDTVYQQILQDSTVKQMLNDGGFAEVDAGQFAAGKAIEKILSSHFLKNLKGFTNKIPYVAYGQFATDMIYNATDWWLSYQRIRQLREVSGQETKAAMGLQMHIETTLNQLRDCIPGN